MQQLKLEDCIRDVAAFHNKFNINVNPLDNPEVAELRVNRQKEELEELRTAKTLADAADAIIDAVYIAAGTIQLLGDRFLESERMNGISPYLVKSRLQDLFCRATHIGRELPLQDLWFAVHHANMQKARGTAETSKYGSSFDIVKPEGWRAPDIGAILKKHGINPDQLPKKFLK